MSLSSTVLLSALSAWPTPLPSVPAFPGSVSGGACALRSVLSLSPYQAVQTALGELSLEVRCPDPGASYRLEWPQATILPGGLGLRLSNGLRLTVLDATGELSGQVTQTGSRHLKFAVRAEAGQWGVRQGQASLRGPLLSPLAGGGQ